jgi:(4-(4-[2-(gamma-L-glutamylamino)ethyl]phenoxymethyl)furan-2-yl)methanamine synthase
MIFGWDLGGAHVKLAVLDANGALVRAAQGPCALWLGVEHLERVLRDLVGGGSARAQHGLTMTGELVDFFPDRATGVATMIDTFLRVIDPFDAQIFAGDRFLDPDAAKATWGSVASANWLASATLTAMLISDALMLDIGSTTTDVALIANGRVQTRGHEDRDRLAREELVYTGVVRTPLATVAGAVPFGGEWVSVMAERFATTGDIYRITAELDPQFDQAETADGRARSRDASMRRLARMIGCDFDAAPAAEWERLARWFSHAQAERIRHACDRALSRGLVASTAPVVGLGVGHFLAARLAASLARPYVEFAALLDAPTAKRLAVNTCGPAYAVAELRRRMA